MQQPASVGQDQSADEKRVPLVESLANAISDAIAGGDLRSGERIIEIPMAQRLGVSRVPLRESLKILHAQGILIGGGHKGFRVADFGEASLRRINELRLPVESILLRDALDNWRTGISDVTLFEPIVDRMWTAARNGDRRETVRADIAFHRVIRDAAKNEMAGTVWDVLARRLHIIFSLHDYMQSELRDLSDHHSVYYELITHWIADPPCQAEIADFILRHMAPGPRRRPGRD